MASIILIIFILIHILINQINFTNEYLQPLEDYVPAQLK